MKRHIWTLLACLVVGAMTPLFAQDVTITNARIVVANGTVIDRAGWKALGGAYDGHALVFDRDANRTCAATAPFGTAGDFGTPGAPDDGCADPDAGF